MNKNYLIYYMQTVGIILVVLGHSFYQNMFNPLVHWIYAFHMPLFFLISGYLLHYTARRPLHQVSMWGWNGFIMKKAYRLLLPYALISTLFFIPKIYLNQLVARPVDASWQGYADMLLFPYHNIIDSFWFLPTLFLIYVVAMSLIKLKHGLLRKHRIHPLLVLLPLVVVNIYIPTDKSSLLNLNGVAHYMLYFTAGYYFCRYQVEKVLESHAWWIAPFTLIISLLPTHSTLLISHSTFHTPHSTFLAFNGILMTISFGQLYLRYRLTFLNHLFGANYTIYLLSFFPQFVANQLLLHFVKLPWQATTLLAFVTGLYIPYYIYRWMQCHPKNPLAQLLTFITGQRSFQTKA